jgi:hypothetical protein
MIRRQKLGNTYTKSPSDNVRSWFVINLSKICFTIFISIAYLIVLYVIIGVVRFLGTEVAGVWEDVDYRDIYAGPYGIFFKIVGIVFIIVYVFRDRPRKR